MYVDPQHTIQPTRLQTVEIRLPAEREAEERDLRGRVGLLHIGRDGRGIGLPAGGVAVSQEEDHGLDIVVVLVLVDAVPLLGVSGDRQSLKEGGVDVGAA